MDKIETLQEKIFEEISIRQEKINKIQNCLNPISTKKIEEQIKEIKKYNKKTQNKQNHLYEKMNDGYFIGIVSLAGIATAAAVAGYYYLTL